MKKGIVLVFFLCTLVTYAQSITVDSQTFTPQQLIEDILIDSDCITNVTVTNVVGGDFAGTDQSYGFFDATGTNFPFESGIILSTGRLANAPGPNTGVISDNAPGWGIEPEDKNDLLAALQEADIDLFNATVIEFEFTSVATQVSFRYLFASEEYQENNPNSCNFSDLFGFLIRQTNNQEQYQNIALVPDTNTPVKATTVTPGVPGSCEPQNETYFGNFNPVNSPTHFNGQTAILTATADVVPNQSYQVKLIIADEINALFDSAVFLEAGSFQLSTDLGPNRFIATGNALCENETLELNANQAGSPSFDWFRDGVLVQSTPSGCVNCGTYEVTQPGTYMVEVGLNNTCVSFGEVVIEYGPLPIVEDSVLIECDLNEDGLTTYNLFDAEADLTGNDNNSAITDFFLDANSAITNSDPITNPTNFENSSANQMVYARIINPANCFDIAELELQTSNNFVNIQPTEACDGDIMDGFAEFDLTAIEASIIAQIPTGSEVSYYETEVDALNEINELPITYQNTIPNTQTIFVRVNNNNQCFSISEADLNVIPTPLLADDESVFYCTNTFPETITLFGGVLDDLPNNYFYDWSYNGTATGINTSFIEANEIGTYTVLVTDPNGCSSSRTITVNPSSIAVIEDISTEGIAPNNTITVSISGDGVYEFALDDPNGFYQESNVFTNVSSGFHTLYIRDRNGCGITEQEFPVLGFPKFFTPNGDDVNDRWQIIGLSEQLVLIKKINIFNRYGKFITQLNTSNLGWDGSFNGKQLPSDDYWFIAEFLDGRNFTGHFALKR